MLYSEKIVVVAFFLFATFSFFVRAVDIVDNLKGVDMITKKLLQIPEKYKISKIKISSDDNEIHIHIEPYKKKKAICSYCGKEHTDGSRGTKIVTVRDMAMVERKVYLHVTKRRYRCPEDGKLHVEKVEWIKKKAEVPLDMRKKYIVLQP